MQPPARRRRRRAPAALLTVAAVAATLAVARAQAASAARTGAPFDVQAHRGGIALTAESTLPAFARALRLGVTTLELDTQVTRDGAVVVTHDRQLTARTCRDTAPVRAGDPQWPYLGKYVTQLTLAQVRTLECGSTPQPAWPGQQLAPGARMPLLSEVFDLVRDYRAGGVRMNVETKVEAGAPEQTAPRGRFVRAVAREIDAADIGDQVTIQSFDWGSLMLMGRISPELPLVALDNIDFLERGKPGASPWLGGIDIDDFGGDPVRAIESFGGDAWSPVQGTPQGGAIGDPGFRPYPTRADVRRAHARGLTVIPWTVDDAATMDHFVDLGVDGLITDRPDVLRDVLARDGRRLPRASHDPRAGRTTPVPRTHAHNDYERPLADALDQGFTSVEADVWLRDGELLVGHDEEDLVAGRTLEKLYLDPLARRAAALGGRVYRQADEPLQLLVDVKSDAEPTYAALDRTLRRYRDTVSQLAPRVRERAVEVVVSGNRARDTMLAQRTRFAGYDGRLTDLGSGYPASFMPLVSDNFDQQLAWDGSTPITAAEQARLDGWVQQAHDAGYRLRLWATPDVPGPARTVVWSALADRGVDHLNTDDLRGLASFLTTRDPDRG